MKLDIGGRGSGKTTRVLQWMESAPDGVKRVVVAHDHHAAMGLLRAARAKYGEDTHLESWQFIGIEELRNYNPFPWGKFDFEFAVDQLEMAIQNLFGRYRIVLATLTDDSLPRGFGPSFVASSYIQSEDIPPELFVQRVTYLYSDVSNQSIDWIQTVTTYNLRIDPKSVTWIKAIHFPSLNYGLGHIDIDLMAHKESQPR